jgi:hypothetical protein
MKELAEQYGKVEHFVYTGYNQQLCSDWYIKFNEQELNQFVQKIIELNKVNLEVDTAQEVEYTEPMKSKKEK